MKTIEKDTALLPYVIADRVASDYPVVYEELTEFLANKAERCYARNKHFAKGVRRAGDRGRDFLYAFMYHWADGWVKRHVR